MVQAQAAPFARRVRRKQACGARQRNELEPQRIARAMRVLARVILARDDLVANERGDTIAKFNVFGRQRKVDHRGVPG